GADVCSSDLVHTLVHTPAHSPTQTHAQMCSHTHTYKHTHTHKHMHRCARTHTDTIKASGTAPNVDDHSTTSVSTGRRDHLLTESCCRFILLFDPCLNKPKHTSPAARCYLCCSHCG